MLVPTWNIVLYFWRYNIFLQLFHFKVSISFFYLPLLQFHSVCLSKTISVFPLQLSFSYKHSIILRKVKYVFICCPCLFKSLLIKWTAILLCLVGEPNDCLFTFYAFYPLTLFMGKDSLYISTGHSCHIFPHFWQHMPNPWLGFQHSIPYHDTLTSRCDPLQNQRLYYPESFLLLSD